jgi:hypothetical protein
MKNHMPRKVVNFVFANRKGGVELYVINYVWRDINHSLYS